MTFTARQASFQPRFSGGRPQYSCALSTRWHHDIVEQWGTTSAARECVADARRHRAAKVRVVQGDQGDCEQHRRSGGAGVEVSSALQRDLDGLAEVVCLDVRVNRRFHLRSRHVGDSDTLSKGRRCRSGNFHDHCARSRGRRAARQCDEETNKQRRTEPQPKGITRWLLNSRRGQQAAFLACACAVARPCGHFTHRGYFVSTCQGRCAFPGSSAGHAEASACRSPPARRGAP